MPHQNERGKLEGEFQLTLLEQGLGEEMAASAQHADRRCSHHAAY